MVVNDMDKPKRKYSKKDGYTISVVHFLRKQKDDYTEDSKRTAVSNPETNIEEPKYPIYVRVTFLGKTVSLRSKLSSFVATSEYDSYILLPDVARLMKLEEMTIRATVRLFKPEAIPSFRISQWSYFYSRLNVSLYLWVRSTVIEELRNALVNHPLLASYPQTIRELTGQLQSLPFLASLDFEPAVLLMKKYMPLFRMLSIDEHMFYDNFDRAYSIWDWKTGSLNKLLESENNPYLEQGMPMLEAILSRVTLAEDIL